MDARPYDEDPARTRAAIRDRYTRAAQKILRWTTTDFQEPSGAMGVDDDELLETGPDFGSALYSPRELAQLPRPAIRASLGCGSPTADAPLSPGQLVADVGCGGAIDTILAAAAVGPYGCVIGIDFSTAMIELAQRNARAADAANAVFAVGLMERLPLSPRSVDVVISNAALHLSVDKEGALAELFRVLRPGGRLHAVDIVADDSLSLAERRARVSVTNTTAGVLATSEYRRSLTWLGFVDVRVRRGHAVADRVTAARVTAVRPAYRQDGRVISL